MPTLQAQTTKLVLYGAEVRAQGFAYASLEPYRLNYIPSLIAAATIGDPFAFSQHFQGIDTASSVGAETTHFSGQTVSSQGVLLKGTRKGGGMS